MEVGQTVYTVNNVTNKVDSWTCDGVLHTEDGLLVRLVNGERFCYLPAKCVFLTEASALAVAKK